HNGLASHRRTSTPRESRIKSLKKEKQMRGLKVAAMAAFVSTLSFTAASAQSVADFYRGKTIRMIIGAAAGGGYDIPGRTVANHLARHIPGNPNIIVENMPGAASLIMTNYLYNIAARDGTAMGMPNNNVPLEP